MKSLQWNRLDQTAREAALARPVQAIERELEAAVARVIEQVRADGDSALRALTRRFDGVEVGDARVSEEEFAQAALEVPAPVQAAMAEARERLIAWHQTGMAADFEIETAPGVRCGRVLRGISRVGLYVPAGSAPLPSTALMLGVPAALAACEDIVLCTPPRPDGRADASVLAVSVTGIRRLPSGKPDATDLTRNEPRGDDSEFDSGRKTGHK